MQVFKFDFNCIDMQMWERVCMRVQVPQGSQKGASHPLRLELQAAVSCFMWMLETDLGLSARAVCHLKSLKDIRPPFFIFE